MEIFLFLLLVNEDLDSVYISDVVVYNFYLDLDLEMNDYYFDDVMDG